MSMSYYASQASPVSLENGPPPLDVTLDESISSSAHIPQESSFRSVMPGVKALLEMDNAERLNRVLQSGDDIISLLTNNIFTLQDGFLETLYACLEEAGIDLEHKLTLRLDTAARLAPNGEHPDKDRVQAMLDRHPELAAAFVEIAAQSAALGHLRSLRTLSLYDNAADGYAAMVSGNGERTYQISMKGDMNHFYFCR